MAGQDKRVIEQQATSEVFADDWFLKDSVTEGTTKISSENLKAWINDGMATEGDIETVVKNIADTYSESESYAEGDLCIHEYALFKCTGTTTGAWDSTKWQATTVAELFDSIDLSAEAISYDNTASGLEADNVQDAIDEVVADVNAVETALETKAEQNGIYDDLVAGNLLSDSYTADNAPYLYRQSPSASSVEQNIVGGTVAWNQLVQNGNFESTTNWSTFRSTLTVNNNIGILTLGEAPVASAQINQQVNIPSNHKILLCGELNSSVTGDISIRTFKSSSGGGTSDAITVNIQANTWTKYNVIRALNTDITKVFAIYAVASENSTLQLKNIQIIDLTQMLGTTIADYIYSLEQATAGSGIAWLKANGFLTKDYYAYDSGSLQSVKTSGRKIVGKNLFNKTTITKDKILNRTYGTPTNNEGSYISDYIPITNGTFKFSVAPAQIGVYDKNKTFNRIIETGTDTLVISDSNDKFIRFSRRAESFVSIDDDIQTMQMEFGSIATAYEPYKEVSYPLDSDLTLRGIPKLDSNNNLYYDGDIYESDGSVKRRYGIVDLSTLSWTAHNGVSMKASLPTVKIATSGVIPNIISTNYKSSLATDITSEAEKNGIGVSTVEHTIFVSGQSAGTGYLVYELATPTSETADAFINPQIVDARGTEEYVDYAESQGTRDVAIPVGHNSKYYADLKAKIENIPDVPSTNGTYTLKATRSASGVTYNWVSG